MSRDDGPPRGALPSVTDLHIYGGALIVAVGAALSWGYAAGLIAIGAFLSALGLWVRYGRRAP